MRESDSVGNAATIYRALEELDTERKARIDYEPAYRANPGLKGNVTNLNVGTIGRATGRLRSPHGRSSRGGSVGRPESRAEVRSQIEETIAEAAANDDWLADHPPTVEWFGWQAEPHEVDSDGELATLAKRVGEDVTGRSGSFVGGNAGLDERFYDLYYDVDAVSVGPTGSNLHGADEHTTVPSLLETATTIASIAIEYCGIEGKGELHPAVSLRSR